MNFTYESNRTPVTIMVEKQGTLGTFSQVDQSAGISCSIGNNVASAVFGENVAAGTYRICISIDLMSRNDDVYFTFIVE